MISRVYVGERNKTFMLDGRVFGRFHSSGPLDLPVIAFKYWYHKFLSDESNGEVPPLTSSSVPPGTGQSLSDRLHSKKRSSFFSWGVSLLSSRSVGHATFEAVETAEVYILFSLVDCKVVRAPAVSSGSKKASCSWSKTMVLTFFSFNPADPRGIT